MDRNILLVLVCTPRIITGHRSSLAWTVLPCWVGRELKWKGGPGGSENVAIYVLEGTIGSREPYLQLAAVRTLSHRLPTVPGVNAPSLSLAAADSTNFEVFAACHRLRCVCVCVCVCVLCLRDRYSCSGLCFRTKSWIVLNRFPSAFILKTWP